MIRGGRDFFSFILFMQLVDLKREFRVFALCERGMRGKTLREIFSILSRLCTFVSSQNMAELNSENITKFLRYGRMERAWSAKTFRIYRQYLKTFFTWCCKKGYVSTNPVTSIECPPLPKRIPRCLSHQEAKKVFYHAHLYLWQTSWQSRRNEAIIATFMMAGLRLQELLNLTTEDIHLKEEEIFVRVGKGEKDRIVPIHPRLQQLLCNYREQSKLEHRKSHHFFHSSRSSKPLLGRDIRNVFNKITASSGIKFTPHMLRHTFAREMLDSGLDLFKLKELLGHSNIATTQIYASISKRKLKESIRTIRIY